MNRLKKYGMRYASTADTISQIALDYKVSSSTISKALKTAIKLGFVDLKTAERIKRKADYNANVKVLELRIL